MPNWTYLILHFFHTMALVVWVGGIVAIGILVAPVAFEEAPSRPLAGRIVGRALARLDRLVVVCIVALVVTSALMIAWFDRWSAWYAIEYACIVMMSSSAIFSMAVVSPRLSHLRDRLGRGAAGGAATDEFERLHRVSVLAMQFNLACGTVAVLFS